MSCDTVKGRRGDMVNPIDSTRHCSSERGRADRANDRLYSLTLAAPALSRLSRSPLLLVTLSWLLLATGAIGKESQSFFKTHCIKCHGPEKQKGKLRLDTLTWSPAASHNAETWQAIVDRISDGEMPPEEEPQPDARDKTAIVDALKKRIAGASHEAKKVILRRLNRMQYRNTIRDLLHIDVSVSDPTELFPADDKLEGFDNLGEALQMSDFLLRQYLKVARLALDQATVEGDFPEVLTYTLDSTKARALNYKAQGNVTDKNYVLLFQSDERAPGDARGQNFINCREGATHDGWYEFSFEVESRGRGNLAKELGSYAKRDDYPIYRPEDLHRFEIYATAPNSTSQIQTRPRRLIVAIDLPDNQKQTIRRRIWLPKAWRVEVGFGNGFAYNGNTLLEILDPKFDWDAHDEMDKRGQRAFATRALIAQLERQDAPRIVVHSVKETGPHYDQWPPISHKTALGEAGESIEQHLRDFASRAFRRPVTDAQLAGYVRLAKASPEGLRTAIEAILCSPRFVYLFENPGALDDHALASRLSYFLWNTMPDAPLFEDAQSGRLHDPTVLSGHVDRMLADVRSDEFVNSFVWAWLKLQNTVEMAPDPMKYNDYHRNRINEGMIGESTGFFRQMLTKNLPLRNFIDSDFTVMNADLGRHYGLLGAVNTTAKYRTVSLNRNGHRGGLLGQAAVLTASANGVDTSPVVRGIWILENLLGTPPDLPPDDVEIPEPDARGELTIRQLYAKHRTVASCNDCHKKIDPLGFALENFDAVGGWRTKYVSGHSVDPSGRMPNGESFKDITGLKQIMLRDLDQFSRNLSTKLLTYATGRTMEVADRAEIDRIAEEALRGGQGLRDLVKAVTTSQTFLSK
jgi:hypothetical protein